jgi:hypothetical protein
LKKKLLKTTISILLAILLLPVWSYAIDFYNDGWITDGNNFDTVNVWNTGTINMIGGKVRSLGVFESSTFNLQSGDISGFITILDTGNLTISGGFVGDLQLYNSAVASISGGSITGELTIYNDAIIHIYGQDFVFVPFGGHGPNGWITGRWADNSQFSIYYRNLNEQFPGSHLVLHIIPEPCTLGLIGFGLFFMRRAVKHLCK